MIFWDLYWTISHEVFPILSSDNVFGVFATYCQGVIQINEGKSTDEV